MPPIQRNFAPTSSELQILRDKLIRGTMSAVEAETFLRFGSSTLPGALVEQVEAWDALYHCFDIPCEPSQISIPDRKEGFDRLIMVPEAITPRKIITELERHMDVWIHPDLQVDLDAATLQNRRQGPKGYAIWVREDPEADQANEHSEQATITLMERLLLGMLHIKQSGEQLDVIGGTLCSGSRISDGRIPYVEWSDEDCQLAISVRKETAPASLIRPRLVIV